MHNSLQLNCSVAKIKKRKHFATMILLLLFLAATTGCASGQRLNYRPPNQQTQTSAAQLLAYLSNFCIQQCLQPLRQQQTLMTKQQPDFNPAAIVSGASVEAIAQMCRRYNASRDCSQHCQTMFGVNRQTRMALTAFRSTQAVCQTNYEGLLRSLPCYTLTATANRNICLPRCRVTPTDDVALRLALQVAQRAGNVAQMANVLGKICSNAICRHECEAKVMLTECASPQEPMAVARKILESTFSSVADIWKQMGTYPFYPAQCKRLELFQ